MIAVFKTGGKQHVVREHDVLRVEKLPHEVGAEIGFDAMLVANEDGSDVKIGSPVVAKSQVKVKILEQGRTEKMSVQKYKNKTRYRRFNTHRQPWTKIEVAKIVA